MMHVKTGCTLKLTSEVGMIKDSMRDFVTAKERLSFKSVFYKKFSLITFIVIVFAIGSIELCQTQF